MRKYFGISIGFLFIVPCACTPPQGGVNQEVRSFLQLLVQHDDPTLAEYAKFSGDGDPSELELIFELKECSPVGWARLRCPRGARPKQPGRVGTPSVPTRRAAKQSDLSQSVPLRYENYRRSSARAHCGLTPDPLLTRKPHWQRQFESIGDWSAWLAEGDESQRLQILRRTVEKGLPCGSDEFIQKLEKLTGRALPYRPRGRPKKEGDE